VQGNRGGEDIATAVVIPDIGINNTAQYTGTTSGFADNYDETCPTPGLSPDVVYSYTPEYNQRVDLLLCNSSYMTKMFVYDGDETNLIACNTFGDPTCEGTPPRSALLDLEFNSEQTYYIVIDGYQDQSGDYILDITTYQVGDGNPVVEGDVEPFDCAPVDEPLIINITATDPYGEEITSLTMVGPGNFDDNGDGTGTYSWTPTYYDIAEDVTITFTAEDESSQTGTLDYIFDVDLLCTTICGDFHGDGLIDISDIKGGCEYLFENGDPPYSSFNGADCDNHYLYTISDLGWLVSYMFQEGPYPICPPINPPLNGPENDSIYINVFESSYPPAELLPDGETGMTVHFHVSTNTTLHAASMPVRIMVDGEIPIIDVIEFPPPSSGGFRDFGVIDHDRSVVAMGLTNEFPPEKYEIGYIYISAPPIAETWRPITIEWDSLLTPIQNGRSPFYPFVRSGDIDCSSWTPTINRFPCMGERRGNIDYDEEDELDIADLVYLVNFMFKEGPPPKCFEEADVNQSISLDIADLVYIVNYMFNDGPAPEMCPQE